MDEPPMDESPDFFMNENFRRMSKEYGLMRKDSNLSLSTLIKPCSKSGVPPAFMGLSACPQY